MTERGDDPERASEIRDRLTGRDDSSDDPAEQKADEYLAPRERDEAPSPAPPFE